MNTESASKMKVVYDEVVFHQKAFFIKFGERLLFLILPTLLIFFFSSFSGKAAQLMGELSATGANFNLFLFFGYVVIANLMFASLWEWLGSKTRQHAISYYATLLAGLLYFDALHWAFGGEASVYVRGLGSYLILGIIAGTASLFLNPRNELFFKPETHRGLTGIVSALMLCVIYSKFEFGFSFQQIDHFFHVLLEIEFVVAMTVFLGVLVKKRFLRKA